MAEQVPTAGQGVQFSNRSDGGWKLRGKLSGDDVTVAAAAGLFVVSALLPWFEIDREPARGFDPPYAGLVQLAALAAVVMAAEVALAASRGSSLLAPALRGRVHLALGCGVLAAVGFKYLVRIEGARHGLWIAMASAALLAYEGYLRYWEAKAPAASAPGP